MKIRTMNRNNLKDPRHEDFNYNTIALSCLVSLMKQPFLGNLNIFSVQLTTSTTIERESHFKSWVDPKMIIQKRSSTRSSVKMETMSSNLITAQRFAGCVGIHFLS